MFSRGARRRQSGRCTSIPFFLVLVRCRLRTLSARRYWHVNREFVPKSAERGTYVLDNLPEHQWRNVVRMRRSTYPVLTGLLSEHLPQSRLSWDGPKYVDRLQRIALFRLGHYGNSASTLHDVYALGEVRVADNDHSCGNGLISSLQHFYSCLFMIFSPQVSMLWPTSLGWAQRRSTIAPAASLMRSTNWGAGTLSGRTRSRRVELGLFAWEKYGFCGCIGSVYGSQVPLAYAPRV